MTAAGNAVAAAIILVVLALLPPPATPDPISLRTCDDSGRTYAPNSTFEANLNLVVSRVLANASTSPAGAAYGTAGVAPDQADALALCRGDTNASACGACLARASSRDALRKCAGRKEVTSYEDVCFLTFSGQRLLDSLSPSQWRISELLWHNSAANESVVNVPDAWFGAAVAKVLNATADHAVAAAATAGRGNASADARKYFATGEEDFEPRMYGLVQCVPEMAPAQCRDCLRFLLDSMTATLLGGNPQWVKVFSQWCNAMYSVRPFFDGRSMLQVTAPPAPPVAPPFVTTEPAAGKKRSSAGIAAGIVCSLVIILILSVIMVVRFKRRTQSAEADHPLKKMNRSQCTIFDLPTLQEATENFSEKNKLGQGGFGIVYKGILPDGQEIAVKKLLGITGHGLQELHNEVLLLAELQHKNLVRLQGVCLHRDDTLLVYEYIKNGSLDSFLFDVDMRDALKWEQQYNIILGIAKGILYLHEDSSMRIIHRDLKANNILLDEEMEPKIADFGLARLLGEGHTHTRTTRVVGTFGYMAPEYQIGGSVSPKVDIFSFGVLVLEIVTRRRNSNSEDHDAVNLLSDVWNCWTKGTISEMMDASLEGYSLSQALRCIHLGLLCVQPDPDDRPHISSVVFMLTRDNMELHPPSEPAFYFGRKSPTHGQGNYVYDRSDFISMNGVTITEPYPR